MRKFEMQRPERQPAPPMRRVFVGLADAGHGIAVDDNVGRQSGVAGPRRGPRASVGVAVGRARIVCDPLASRIAPDDIVVASETDPRWIVHLLQTSTLLVERGSLMSHAAVLARELGLPCVVALPDLLRCLADEPVILVDSGAGTVTRV